MSKFEAQALHPVEGFGIDTQLVTLGRSPELFNGFVNTPVYHGSTVLSSTVKELLVVPSHISMADGARQPVPRWNKLFVAWKVVPAQCFVHPGCLPVPQPCFRASRAAIICW